jgi:plasmid maintenance system antidote protein VapI
MVLRLSVALGRTPGSWLAMQHNYDLSQTRRHIDLRKVKRLDVDGA